MRCRVLLIEEDRCLCELLADSLEGLGYQVTRGFAAGDGVEWLERESFDVALFDLALRGIGALRLCRIARASSAALRIIVITEFGDTAAAARALQEGADDFISKPIELAILEHMLARATRERRATPAVDISSVVEAAPRSVARPGRLGLWQSLRALFGRRATATVSAAESAGEAPASRRRIVNSEVRAHGVAAASSNVAAAVGAGLAADEAIRRSGPLPTDRLSKLASQREGTAYDWFEGSAQSVARGARGGAQTFRRVPKLSGKHRRQ